MCVEGLMCFSVAEARYLALEQGHDDLMVAYPCSKQDLEAVWEVVVVHGKNMQVSNWLACPIDFVVLCGERRDLTSAFLFFFLLSSCKWTVLSMWQCWSSTGKKEHTKEKGRKQLVTRSDSPNSVVTWR